MMVEYSFKYCRICGGDISIDAEICPHCSSRQQPGKTFCSTGIIIVLALIGFFGITLLGIMSAHAIQHLMYVRTSSFNRLALNNIQAAQKSVENYVLHSGSYPKNLAQTSFTPDKGVTVDLREDSAGSYSLVGFHKQGNMVYLIIAGNSTIYYKKKNIQYFRVLRN